MRKIIGLSPFIILFVLLVLPVSAQVATYFTLTSVDTTSCTPGNFIAVSFNYGVAATDSSTHIWTLTNQRTGMSNGPVNVGPFAGATGPNFFNNTPVNTVPVGTQADDVLIQQVVATSNLGPGTTSSLVFDCTTGLPPTVPSVASIPTQTPQIIQPVFFDGRINNYDTGNPVVVYGHDFENGRGLVIYNTNGVLLLEVRPEAIEAVAECPDSNTLIASNGEGVSVYRLVGTCDFQVIAPTADPAKNYIMIFSELFHNAGYTSHEE